MQYLRLIHGFPSCYCLYRQKVKGGIFPFFVLVHHAGQNNRVVKRVGSGLSVNLGFISYQLCYLEKFKLHFSHMKYMKHNVTYIIRPLWRLKEIMQVTCSAEHMVQSRLNKQSHCFYLCVLWQDTSSLWAPGHSNVKDESELPWKIIVRIRRDWCESTLKNVIFCMGASFYGYCFL